MPSMLVRLLYRLALAVCMLVVAVLALSPAQDVPGFDYDKLNHLLAFIVMAWLAEGSWPQPRHALWRWMLLLGYGLLIELAQSQLPTREFSWLDLATDALGVLLYTLGSRLARDRSRSAEI